MAAGLLACVLLAGCVGVGARVEGPAFPAAPGAAPGLPGGVALEGASLVARDGSQATFLWEGVLSGPVVSPPLVGALVGSFELATLRLPAGAPLRVEARLGWNGSADLDLFLHDGARTRCASDAAEGGTSQPVVGAQERCVAWAPAGAARTWGVEVAKAEGVGGDVPFQVVLTVATYAPAPRYDLAAGSGSGVAVPDPAVPGGFDVASAEYDFGALLVEDRVTKRPYPVRVLGVVHFPAGAEGGLPLVVLLHGRAAWCRGPVQDARVVSHCRAPEPVGMSVPSHRGYDEDARLLASHGYVVASIDANDVNAMDSPRNGVPNGDDGIEARARLLLRTLDELRGVHERGGSPANPGLDPLRGRLDLSRIGLMGHSRGAEGVTRAPGHAEETGHWSAGSLLAVYSLAGATRPHLPDYLMPLVKGPTAYLAVSPYCDGDVQDLGNVDYYDASRTDPARGPLAHLLFMGSNHNHYNAQWTEDDAEPTWGADAYCGAQGEGYGRLAPEDQARHQRAYLPAFFRLHLGGESAFAPLFTGDAAPPPSACPEGMPPCPGLVHVSVQPLPDRVRGIEDAGSDDALHANDLGGTSAFAGFDSVAWCDPRASPRDDPCAHPRAVGLAPRLRLAWDDAPADAAWRTTIPPDASDLGAYDTLAFRIGVDFADDAPPGGVAPRVLVTLEDARGRRSEVDASDHGAAVFAPPGDASRRVVLNQARIPLDAFGRVDVGNVAAVEVRILASAPGAVHLADLAVMDLRG